jgi:peptidoglycan hydrolase-like protein with peptidoglycan-binding domain
MLRKVLVTAALSATLATLPAHAKEKGSAQAAAAQQSQEVDGTPIYLDAPAVIKVQQALNAKGFNAGTVDGQWSKRTMKAAQQFQRANGLAPTGTLTIDTINSLGLGAMLTGQGAQGAVPRNLADTKGVPVYVSPTGVAQVQQALSQQGFPVQSVDGQWGPGTEKAVENFQRVNNLEPTGKLDTGLITALGVGQQIFAAGQQQGQQQQAQQGQAQQGQQSMGQQRQQQAQQPSQQAQQAQQQGQAPQQTAQGQQPPQGQSGASQQGQPTMAQQGQQPGPAPQQGQQQPQQQTQQQPQQPGQQQQQQASNLKWGRGGPAGKGTPLYAGPETVRQVQQALNRNGFGVESVDGDWDRETAQSLRKYQEAKGLVPSGKLTVQTLASLGLGNVLAGQGAQQQRQQGQQQMQQRQQQPQQPQRQPAQQ